jgi:ribosome recycling factor
MANQFITKHVEEVNKTIEHYKDDIATLRTGRANPGLVEMIHVDAYGSKMPIMQLASVSIPEPRIIRIEPWDKTLLKAVEKAITDANLGVSASVDGNIVRVTIPMMTEENRLELVKLLKGKTEDAKVALRSIREKIRESIMNAEKNNEITEDDKFDFLKELDKEIEAWNNKVAEFFAVKEKEILTV